MQWAYSSGQMHTNAVGVLLWSNTLVVNLTSPNSTSFLWYVSSLETFGEFSLLPHVFSKLSVYVPTRSLPSNSRPLFVCSVAPTLICQTRQNTFTKTGCRLADECRSHKTLTCMNNQWTMSLWNNGGLGVVYKATHCTGQYMHAYKLVLFPRSHAWERG